MRAVISLLLRAVIGSSALADAGVSRISVDIPLGTLTIVESDAGQRPMMDGFGVLHEAGAPQLPMRIFPIAIPPGAEVIDVT